MLQLLPYVLEISYCDDCCFIPVTFEHIWRPVARQANCAITMLVLIDEEVQMPNQTANALRAAGGEAESNKKMKMKTYMGAEILN